METFLDRIAFVKVERWKKENKSYVVYCMAVHLSTGWHYHIEKRYSEFKLFYEELKNESTDFLFDQPFPPKQGIYHSPDCLEARAVYFQGFVDFCLSVDSLMGLLSKFLHVPMKVVSNGDGQEQGQVEQEHTEVVSVGSSDKNPSLLSDVMMSVETETDDKQPSTDVVHPIVEAKQVNDSKRKSKRGSVYFRNLMEETDVDSILEKNEQLTDEELLLLSRRASGGAINVSLPSPTISETFKLNSNELQQVFDTLTVNNDMHSGMSCEQFMSWDEIQNVIELGKLTEAEIKDQFVLFIDKRQSGISVRNFQLLINQLDLMGFEEKESGNGVEVLLSDKMDESTISLLRSILTAHFLFDVLSSDDISNLLSDMTPLVVTAGEDIIRQNDVGELFYCIVDGSAKAFVAGVGEVRSYGRGDSFGELALIHKSPRAATVTATSECKLWSLQLSSFRSIATLSSAKKISRRREASSANKRISRKGSIVCIPDVEEVKGVHEVSDEADEEEKEGNIEDIPDEIKTIYDELAKESNGEGVCLAAIVSWSVMQDAIQSAFISEVIIWKEFTNYISESGKRKKIIKRASISGSDLLNVSSFFQFCMRLQRIIDTNIDMMESLGDQ